MILLAFWFGICINVSGLVMESQILMLICVGVSSIISQFQVEKAHNADLHCVDWSPHDDNYILTGYSSVAQINSIFAMLKIV